MDMLPVLSLTCFKTSAMFLFISPGEVVQVRIRLMQARVLGESDDLFPTSCPQNYLYY